MIKKNEIKNVKDILSSKHKNDITLFFCGIGGIGMCGLALMARSCGFNVIGSDIESNKNTKMLIDKNFKVFIGHNEENVKNVDIFVYSSAINLDTNREALYSKKQNIPVINRGGLLSILMENYFNIVVAGSHGKTTTTALIGHMMNELNKQPNILIGGVLNSCNTNCYISEGKYLVLESDESDGSFDKLPVNIGVITNVDPEHMEFYKTIENLKNYFYDFACKSISSSGLVICVDDEIGQDIYNRIKQNIIKKDPLQKKKIISYGIKNKNADIFADNFSFKQNGISFNLHNKISNVEIQDIFLSNMFGEHNIANTLASISVATIMQENQQETAKTFENFNGIQKRFTIIGKIKNSLVIDDYAHNPQKIQSAVKSCQHYVKCHNISNNLTIVFEPHRYTRVRDGMTMFADALKIANKIVVLPIYASSELPIEGINDEYVFNELKKVNNNVFKCSNNEDDVKKLLNNITDQEDKGLIVFMGAGKSSKIAHYVVDNTDNAKQVMI